MIVSTRGVQTAQNNGQSKMQFAFFLLFSKAALVAASNTSLIPSLVLAEHSK